MEAYTRKSRSMSLRANVVMLLILLIPLRASGAGGPEPAGWYAGDMHVHRSCGAAPEELAGIYTKMDAQSLSFLSVLADMGNGEVQDPATDLQLVTGSDDPLSTSGKILHWDAEWHWDAISTLSDHHALGGHVVSLGLTEAHEIMQEYTYPIFDWAHQQNAIAGFAHMQYLDDGIPQELTCCTPLEYPVEVALGAADFISEDIADGATAPPGMDPESAVRAYYRLLNAGFRPGFAAGTDYPCNGGSDPGSLLTYVKVAGGNMTYRNWIEGIAQGRTVVSRNGHNEFLDLAANGSAGPGDEIALNGAGAVPVSITWSADQDLTGAIELVKNGVVVASLQALASQGAPANLNTTVHFAHSGWLAARRMGGNGHILHTGAVFVTVNNAPIRASVGDAEFFVQWMDTLLEKTSPGGAWNSFFTNSLDAAQARYQAARALFQQAALDAASVPSTLGVATAALPDGTTNASYSAALAASGGTAPYVWSITGGSLPDGLSLNGATGVISGTPTVIGDFVVTVQTADSGIPQQTASRSLVLTVAEGVACTTDCTIWPDSATPANDAVSDGQAITVGVKFRPDTGGYITGLRFYKGAANTGTHVGRLWTGTGTLLATVTFANETASGWQEVSFIMPVQVTQNTTYVASFYSSEGYFALDAGYFTTGLDNPPLHALANGVEGGNGVFAYGDAFPAQSASSSNYWVDVVFSTTAPPPATLTSIIVSPASRSIERETSQQFTAAGSYSNGSSQDITSLVAWDSSNTGVATISASGLASAVNSGSTTISATLDGVTGTASLTVLSIPLTITSPPPSGGVLNVPYTAVFSATGGSPPYSWTVMNGFLPTGLSLNTDTGQIYGTPTAAGAYSFTIQATDSGDPVQTSTKAMSTFIDVNGSILIITSSTNPFSTYYAEILRAEGLTEFTMSDISAVTGPVLATYDIVLLGEITLTTEQVTMLSDWVAAGGHLISMRPDKKLAGLLGLTDLSATLANAYLKVDTSSGPGSGIVGETIQYHGTADRYGLNGAAAVATLYSDAATATANVAVSLRSVGANGGQAAAFAYDLARSVVSTRQGNPAWAGQERDGDQYGIIRSDDLFFGDAGFDPQPDWVDLNKVAIPQADEQQRLLANLIIRMNADRKPLPRFWYLPRGLAAAVIMAGDDHNGNGTEGRFIAQMQLSPAGCSVEDWECIRSTSYIYPENNLTDEEAYGYMMNGFEIGTHVSTDCANWTPSSLDSFFTSQLGSWSAKYTSLPPPVTSRLHCIAWSDYATMPAVELSHGIRLDTNYYYWPANWVNDRPGFFTGSGIPMRFADLQGRIIDVYQATTQLTDESGQTYPDTIDTMLDRATGPEGYYGVFTANMHTDIAETFESDAIVGSALARGIPVVSARQMLAWLDGRNASRFTSLSWNGTTLGFTITAGAGANGLAAMVPLQIGKEIASITHDGDPEPFAPVLIKGIQYALFRATDGAYLVTYAADTTPPETTIISQPANPTNQTEGNFTFTANEAATFACSIDGGAFALCASPKNYSNLAAGQTHTFAVRATDLAGNTDDTPASYTWTIDTLPPTAAVSYAPIGPYKAGAMVTITATFMEPIVDAPVLQIAISGANALTETAMTKTSATVYTYAHTVGAGDGTANVALSAGTDLAGNAVAAAPASGGSFSVDNTPPDTFLNSHPPDPTNQTSASFSFTSPDEGAGFECQLDAGDYAPCTSPAAFSGLAGGQTHTFQVRAADAAGNMDETPAIFSWTIDTTALGMTVGTTAPDPTRTSPVPVTVEFSKTVADFTLADVQVTNGGVTSGSFGGSGALYAFTVTPSGDGLVKIDIDAEAAHDAAGNGNEAASLSVTFDATPPNTAITSQPTDPTNQTDASFAFTADEAAAFACSIDGGPYAPCASPQGYSGLAADQTHTFSVSATDPAGNSDGTPASYTWTIDTTAPDAPAVFGTTPTNDTTPTWSWSSAGGNGTYRYKVNDADLGSGATTTSATSFTPASALPDGVHTLYVQERDEAGNWSTTGSRAVVIDTAAPTLAISGPSLTMADNSVSVTYIITYTGADAVTLDAGHVTLNRSETADGTVEVSGTGSAARTVTISNITGFSGSLGITIGAGTAGDAAGNLAAGAGPSATFAVDNSSGDFNGDGVDAADALKALRITAGLDAPAGTDMAHGDVAPLVGGAPQPDKKIDIGDVVVILRKAVGAVYW